MSYKEINLGYLLYQPIDEQSFAEEHALDISASIYKRMKELNMSRSELASAMRVSPGQISKLIEGDTNIAIKTIAKLEAALSLNLTSSFIYTSSGQERIHE